MTPEKQKKLSVLKILYTIAICFLSLSVCSCKTERQQDIEKLVFLLNNTTEFDISQSMLADRDQMTPEGIHREISSIDTTKYASYHGAVLQTKDKKEYFWVRGKYQTMLSVLCDEDQLIQFTDKRYSPRLRFTAFVALMVTKSKNLEKILLENYQDTTAISMFNTDDRSNYCFGSELLCYAQQYVNHDIISKQDSIRNDSLALFTPSTTQYAFTKNLLYYINPKPSYYQRIKELYEKYHINQALRTIARYRKPCDKILIEKGLCAYQNLDKASKKPDFEANYCDITYNALTAVELWPDKLFQPYLRRIRDYELQSHRHNRDVRFEQLFRTVLAYPDPWAYQFVSETLQLPMQKRDEYYEDETASDYFVNCIYCSGDNPLEPKYRDLLKKYPPYYSYELDDLLERKAK
ncbi:hypothetical protein [Prevotella sp.]|uniref:hypothetical protein n=1 Tax=Prevotella sp. TaxID=59823 RepID=UPI003DA2CB9D